MGTEHGGRQTSKRSYHNSDGELETDSPEFRGQNDSSQHQCMLRSEGGDGTPEDSQVSAGESGGILNITVNEGQPAWGQRELGLSGFRLAM